MQGWITETDHMAQEPMSFTIWLSPGKFADLKAELGEAHI